MVKNNYHNSSIKRFLDIGFSTVSLIITSPFILLISLIIKISGKGGVFFTQRRMGKDGKIFKIIKFRTMVPNASRLQSRLRDLNESDGPVFKIANDPRFTKFGKLLSKTGLDELPQMINVLNGEMSIVGPRPLPVNEANRLSKRDKIREVVKPGITSSWVINGSHKLTFKKWMSLDKKYIKEASLTNDLSVIRDTFVVVMHYVWKSL